jgi:poly(beta-D-mannuronate) lyase
MILRLWCCWRSLEKQIISTFIAMPNGAIHRLANFSVDGVRDPAPFVKATGVQQEVPRTMTGDQIGWAPRYVQRFPDAALEQMIQAAPSLSVYYLGGLPPGR